ncbi:hypothetical protein [Methanopyrus sp.]
MVVVEPTEVPIFRDQEGKARALILRYDPDDGVFVRYGEREDGSWEWTGFRLTAAEVALLREFFDRIDPLHVQRLENGRRSRG